MKNLLFLLIIIACISCDDEPGKPACDAYYGDTYTGDTSNMNVYTLNYTFNLLEKDTLHSYSFYPDDIEKYYDFHDFNLEFYQDSSGGVFAYTNTLKLTFFNAMQNTTLTNSQGLNEYYGVLDNPNYDLAESRNILFAYKHNELFLRSYDRNFSEINCILIDSLYRPSFLSQSIISKDSIFNSVFTPINSEDYFYYSFDFRECVYHVKCWIKCSFKNNIFTIHEIGMDKPKERALYHSQLPI